MEFLPLKSDSHIKKMYTKDIEQYYQFHWQCINLDFVKIPEAIYSIERFAIECQCYAVSSNSLR